jgi:hypothetical protein
VKLMINSENNAQCFGMYKRQKHKNQKIIIDKTSQNKEHKFIKNIYRVYNFKRKPSSY